MAGCGRDQVSNTLLNRGKDPSQFIHNSVHTPSSSGTIQYPFVSLALRLSRHPQLPWAFQNFCRIFLRLLAVSSEELFGCDASLVFLQVLSRHHEPGERTPREGGLGMVTVSTIVFLWGVHDRKKKPSTITTLQDVAELPYTTGTSSHDTIPLVNELTAIRE